MNSKKYNKLMEILSLLNLKYQGKIKLTKTQKKQLKLFKKNK